MDAVLLVCEKTKYETEKIIVIICFSLLFNFIISIFQIINKSTTLEKKNTRWSSKERKKTHFIIVLKSL